MAWPNNPDVLGIAVEVMVVGSVSSVRSIPSTTDGWSSSSSTGLRTGAWCGSSRKWLNAGVLEDGQRIQVEAGTPQGGSASPLLANVYLHYVFDLWVRAWRRTQARGEVIVVRFADDIVLGFQYKSDAECCRQELTERFRQFRL